MISEIILNSLNEQDVCKVNAHVFKTQILSHLKRLSDADRYLRFGYQIKDEGIDTYVERMTAADIVFAIFNYEMEIVAMAHFAQLEDGTAELGCSVDEEARGKNYGTKLFKRAILTAKVLGIKEIFVQCLSENKAMQHIAKKFEMDINTRYGETEGRLGMSDITPQEIIQYAFTSQLTMYDYAYKKHISNLAQIKNTFASII